MPIIHLTTRRVLAPCTSTDLADQLSTVLHFARRFLIHTHDHFRFNQITDLLQDVIMVLREPDKYSTNDMVGYPRTCLTQMEALNTRHPSLRDNPAYQPEYEIAVATLKHVIHVGVLHNLLNELHET
jgi:hypothetical protein